MIFWGACLSLLAHPAWAQNDGARVLSAEQIAQRIAPLHPKTLVLVFDVTLSTRHNDIFGLERSGAATLIEDGCTVGDRVVLLKFGTGYHAVFDTMLTDNADKETLVNEIPSAPEPGRGTNIRWPHHAALEIVKKDLPRKGVIVLLTDSFNDRPMLTDPNYPDYLDYYTLKGLTIYPHTAQNRDYENLLNTLAVPGIIQQYGIGVGIAPDGRPIERIPKAGQGDDASAGEGGQTTETQTLEGTEQVHHSLLPWILAGLFLLLALLTLFWASLNRAVPLRLKLGDRGTPHDYRLRPGHKVSLGGTPLTAAPGDDVFPLAGIPAPAASAVAGRGGAATLVPAPSPIEGLKVLHNGLPLEGSVPLKPGDEVRLLVPATDTTPLREHRVNVE
jgi:hypothetical protein